MLSSSSMIRPSAPLMLLTKTMTVPAVGLFDLPLFTPIFTTVSLPVLATKSAVRALLKASPLAPNGGTPVVPSRASVTHGVAVPPFGPVRQMMLRNESETYTFPASSNVRSEEHTSELQSQFHLVCR